MKLDIKKLHEVQYDILVEFDRICKKYGLTYFLAFGTLLGAFRHNGFIPWDDDIDTLMPYEDYLKLMEISSEEWNDPYFLQTCDTDKEYRFCFCKVRNSNTTLITKGLDHIDINQGVDIDIYPLIHLSDDDRERRRQYRRTILYMLLQVNEPPKNHGKIYYYGGKICLTLMPKVLRSKLLDRLKANITSFQNEATEYSYIICGNLEIMYQVLKTAWFAESVNHIFENKFFPVPIGAQEWLKIRYGEKYMDLPPVELQGIKLEQFVKVDLDNPYTKYKGEFYCVKNAKRKDVKNDRWVNYT